MIKATIYHKKVLIIIRLFSACLAVLICLLSAKAQPQDKDIQKQLKLFEKVLHEYPVAPTAKKLNLLFTFPQEETLKADTGLWGARYMESDEEGNLFISDSRAHRILIFDRSGNFVRQIGRKGQAPGEFNLPRGIAYAGERLIINDSGNHRIQLFSKNGTFISSFLVYKTYYEIAANENGTIYAVPVRLSNSDSLIDAFNHEGKILFSFGAGKKYSNWQQFDWIKIAASADVIFVAYQSFPILQVYSMSGSFLSESNFGRGFMKAQERMNISRDKQNNLGKVSAIIIVRDIKQKWGKAYVLVGHPRVEILEFDSRGRLNESWWADKTFGCDDAAFAYDSESSKARFYFLQFSPENIVRAFEQAR